MSKLLAYMKITAYVQGYTAISVADMFACVWFHGGCVYKCQMWSSWLVKLFIIKQKRICYHELY